MKNSDIFHISALNIDCGYSLEPPRWGGSNENPQSMFWAVIRKIMYTPVNPSFIIWKWGLMGSKLYRRVFVMKCCIPAQFFRYFKIGLADIYEPCKQAPAYNPTNSSLCLTAIFAVHLQNNWQMENISVVYINITKTRLYNFAPLKPHFYIVKLGFTGVYIIFLISAQKHRLRAHVRTALSRRF